MGAYVGKHKNNRVSHSPFEAEIRAKLAANNRSQNGTRKPGMNGMCFKQFTKLQV
jgi:hypothetical protein